jgi:hypothetical protein
MCQKKITWFKKRRHVHPLLSSGYVSDAPKRVRKTFLLIYTRNYKWPRNITLSIPIHILFLPFSKILLIRRARLFRPVYYIVVKIVLIRIRGKLYSHLILISFLKGLQPLVSPSTRIISTNSSAYSSSCTRIASTSTSCTTISSYLACGLPASRSIETDTGLLYYFR